MKNNLFKNIFFITFITGFSYLSTQAQEGTVNIQQDKKIAELLEIKTSMAESNTIGDRYKIQLFYGDNGEANEVIKKYRSLYTYPSMIVYEAPNYKVWIGNFRNRLEADRALMKIKQSFPGAFIPKPQRR